MDQPLVELREQLLCAGIAPRNVRRYLTELREHLADLSDEARQAGMPESEAHAAAMQRLGGAEALATAFLEKRPPLSPFARTPWLMFWLAPLGCLAVAWVAALTILASGWAIFLPEAQTPFVPLHGFAMVYFGVGRLLYFAAPLLIGWGITVVAARQRILSLWPVAGIVLLAWMGGTAQVQASRSVTIAESGVAQIAAHGVPALAAQGIAGSWTHVLLLLLLTGLPYLFWRITGTRQHAS